MHVVFGIGMQMMMSMLGRPPQNAFLRGALRKPGQDELKYPAGRKSPMGEIAVVARSDCKHGADIRGGAARDALPGHAGPDGCTAAEMHQQERQCGGIHDVVVLVVGG